MGHQAAPEDQRYGGKRPAGEGRRPGQSGARQVLPHYIYLITPVSLHLPQHTPFLLH